MFRFRLGSIPVEVHSFHLLASAVFGWSFASYASQVGPPWLAEYVLEEGHPRYGAAIAAYVLAWMFIVFVSVVVHELGHAIFFRAFGYQPNIVLVWLGGETYPNAPSPIPWHKSVLSTLAGPLFGLLLGAVCWVGATVVGGHSLALDFFLFWFLRANLFWAALNLLPVPPLDGGHVTTTLASRFFGRAGFIAAQGLALLISLAMVAWGLSTGSLLLPVFFAMWGFQCVRAIRDAFQAGRMGEDQRPLAEALRQAQQALSRGALDEARTLATPVLEAGESLTPQLASHAHHLLGWVAVKGGQGRLALDHFAQVQGQPVESHALAAAFSLVGDETRALPLWEMAWRDTGDRTVMHEYGGSLLRAGKRDAALKLPSVDLAAAFSCAERVLFIRGAYSEAAAMGEAALDYVPNPQIAYDAACAFAKAQNVSDAVRLLHRAKELGYRDAAYVASDEDLAPLHGHPGFEAWLTELRQSAAS